MKVVPHTHSNVQIKLLLILVSLVLASSCESKKSMQPEPKQPASIAAQQLPTATEVFHLRSECTELGVKIMSENFIGTALTQSQVSHYNSETNRCYVELTVQSVDLNAVGTKSEYFAAYLFDGQTKELLAFTKIEKGIKSGIAFKKTISSFDKVSTYINEMMKDE